MRRGSALGLTLAALLAGLPAPAPAQKPRDLELAPQAIAVTARPIERFSLSEPGRRRFGALEWVGGLDLSARHPAFGGLSGLAFRDGAGRHLLALSDAGVWFEADLLTEGERPVGLANARIAPLLDEAGRSLAGGPRGDAEALALLGTQALVTFESANAIRRYDLARGGLSARGEALPVPPGVRPLRATRGLEALALLPEASRQAGRLVAIAESPLRTERHHRGFVLGPGGFAFEVVHRDDFHITDAVALPTGDLLTLERRVEAPFGLWVRIRRLPGQALAARAVLDGPEIFSADLREHVLDNLEGMALHRGGDGALYLTLISDDNYSLLQRTLLLRFRLVP